MTPFAKLIPAIVGAVFLAGACAQAPSSGTPSAGAGASGTEASPKAGGVSRDLERQFKSLDTNADGFLTRQELQNPAMARQFDQADKDRDGRLDMAEFQLLQATLSPDRNYSTVKPGASPGAGASGTR